MYKQAQSLFPSCQRSPQEASPVVTHFCSELSDGVSFISWAPGYHYPPEYAHNYELHIAITRMGFGRQGMGFGRQAYLAYQKKLAAAASPAERTQLEAAELARIARVRAAERQAAIQDSLARCQGAISNRALLRATDPARDQL